MSKEAVKSQRGGWGWKRLKYLIFRCQVPQPDTTPPRFGPQASMARYVNCLSLSRHAIANTFSSLFELLKGEVVEIADFAIDHHKRTGDTPTLAVNASSWWYANLSAKGVQEIRNRMSFFCCEKRDGLLTCLELLQEAG